jgi:hypothetical protein
MNEPTEPWSSLPTPKEHREEAVVRVRLDTASWQHHGSEEMAPRYEAVGLELREELDRP